MRAPLPTPSFILPRRPRAALALPVAAALLLAGCATNPAGGPRTPAMLPEIHHALTETTTPAAGVLPAEVARELLPPASFTFTQLSSAPAEPRFDVNVSRLPAAQVFAALAKDTRYSMVVDPDLRTPVTVALKDVTLVEALETLREAYGFEYKVQGSRIIVQSAAFETRVFSVNVPTESRTGRSELRVTSSSLTNSSGGGGGAPGSPGQPGNGSSPPGQSSGGAGSPQESSRITTQLKNDLWPEIDSALHLLVPVDPAHPDGRQLIFSPQSGVIVARALPRELRQIEHYLRSMRLSIERQIVLESKIIEVDLNVGAQTGINWAAFHNGAGARTSAGLSTPGTLLSPTGALTDNARTLTPGSTFAQGASSLNPLFGIAFQTGNFAALLDFLETQGSLQVLSSPRIAAMNNQQAVLKVGTDDFFVTGITTNIASGSGSSVPVITPTITVQPFFSGVALDVTPSIDEDGSIILHVHPSVSTVSEHDKVVNLGTLGNYTLPLASSTVSETDTVVRVHDGNVVAIGGLMKTSLQDSSDGVPVLGGLPGVGYLFSTHQKSRTKQELVILIKPTVVHSDAQFDASRDDFRRAMEGDLTAGHSM
jgi:MSHA biogenesis protein MshL